MPNPRCEARSCTETGIPLLVASVVCFGFVQF